MLAHLLIRGKIHLVIMHLLEVRETVLHRKNQNIVTLNGNVIFSCTQVYYEKYYDWEPGIPLPEYLTTRCWCGKSNVQLDAIVIEAFKLLDETKLLENELTSF